MTNKLDKLKSAPSIVHANKHDLQLCMNALLGGQSPTKLYRRMINPDGVIAIASNIAILEITEKDFSPMTYDLTDDDVYIIKALCDDYHNGKVEDLDKENQ